MPTKAVRTVCTFLQVPLVFGDINFETQGIPTFFHRHATAHAIGRIQCTELNALIGLMTAVSAVREAHELRGQAFSDILVELGESGSD
ncbi:hypothetical protein [Saccharopolyspora mangrovi]|uniref:Uncharacterized protein n=1 Tax=Saccharopolyspora mangrovi TaxID=3082379 RepID=A0ABU6AK53_9PSEU|nr:hypothetical protein [Saccharopolyspora sp. S2-29]MEB3371915.1 hypothetical protein [Saccharopolyspora sp. S2-29]